MSAEFKNCYISGIIFSSKSQFLTYSCGDEKKKKYKLLRILNVFILSKYTLNVSNLECVNDANPFQCQKRFKDFM